MQQSMDNMVIRKPVIQKRTNNSLKDKVQEVNEVKKVQEVNEVKKVQEVNEVKKVQEVNEVKKVQEVDDMKKFHELDETKKFQAVNSKTSNLLAEAEKLLKTLPESKERKWIESFIERMYEIARMIEATAHYKNLLKDSDSIKGAPIPNGLPKQPTQTTTSAVPEINPFQKPNGMMAKLQMASPEINPFQKPNGMMAKLQMTSPEINRVLPEDEQSDHQAVTKPVALSNKVDEAENDELVWELENLHKENTHQNLLKKDEGVNQARVTTTPSAPLSPEKNQATTVNEVAETEKLKAKLIKEIEEFHRRGGVMPKEVMDILNADAHKITDPVQSRIDAEMKFTEAGMKDRRGMMRLNDLNNEERQISMANMRNMPPYPVHQLQFLKVNYTFPTRYPNFVQGFPQQTGYYYQNMPPLYRAQPYQGRPQIIDPNFQKMNPYNQGKYHGLDMLHQQGRNPDALKQRLFKPHMSYNGRLPPPNYQNYFMRNNYGPYPYMHNWNPQNSTIQLPQMMSPYANNQARIGTQLSDQMKRELRDGKIIVLSDSVVRSNFEPDSSEKTTQSTTEKPELHRVDMKNETVTEN